MSEQTQEYEVKDYTDEELKNMPSEAKKAMFRRQFKFKGEFLMGKQLLLQAQISQDEVNRMKDSSDHDAQAYLF